MRFSAEKTTGGSEGRRKRRRNARTMRSVMPRKKAPPARTYAPAGLCQEKVYYCFTVAGVVLAGAVFTVFLAAFLWCFLAVLAAAVGAGLVAAAAGAGVGAGDWANVSGMVASAKAKGRIVGFIYN